MKIEDLILNLTHFGANFHLNETVRFGKNNIVSCISLEKKKKQKRCRFEMHHMSSSSPGRAENKGRRIICRLLFSSLSLSLFPKTQKNPRKHPTCPNPDPWPTTRRKNRGDKPLRVALRRLPSGRLATPYPCAMTGQG
jgi:hypothetical protein